MSSTLAELRTLSVAERIQLVEDFWDSIAQDTPEAVALSAAQAQAIRKRLAAHDSDPGSAVPWEAVRDPQDWPGRLES
jgi:putative addiction module component (TIGR02574 family)